MNWIYQVRLIRNNRHDCDIVKRHPLLLCVSSRFRKPWIFIFFINCRYISWAAFRKRPMFLISQSESGFSHIWCRLLVTPKSTDINTEPVHLVYRGLCRFSQRWVHAFFWLCAYQRLTKACAFLMSRVCSLNIYGIDVLVYATSYMYCEDWLNWGHVLFFWHQKMDIFLALWFLLE